MSLFSESANRFNRLLRESDEELRKLERTVAERPDDAGAKVRLRSARERAGIYKHKTPMATARGHLAVVKNIYRKEVTGPEKAQRSAENRHPITRGVRNPEQQQHARRITLAKHRAAAGLGIERMKEALKKPDLDERDKVRFQGAMDHFKKGRALAKEAHKFNRQGSDSENRSRAVNRLALSANHSKQRSQLKWRKT